MPVIVIYPLIPWVGVMALGYAAGPAVFSRDAGAARRIAWAGALMVLGFVVLRTLNGYGDPSPRFDDGSPELLAMSFLNVTKYPPSLLFVLMTLGPALVAVPLLRRARGPAGGCLRHLRPGAVSLLRDAPLPGARARGRRRCRAGLSRLGHPHASTGSCRRGTASGCPWSISSGFAWWRCCTRCAGGTRRSRRGAGGGGCRISEAVHLRGSLDLTELLRWNATTPRRGTG